jgi:hypothetical protein
VAPSHKLANLILLQTATPGALLVWQIGKHRPQHVTTPNTAILDLVLPAGDESTTRSPVRYCHITWGNKRLESIAGRILPVPESFD